MGAGRAPLPILPHGSGGRAADPLFGLGPAAPPLVVSAAQQVVLGPSNPAASSAPSLCLGSNTSDDGSHRRLLLLHIHCWVGRGGIRPQHTRCWRQTGPLEGSSDARPDCSSRPGQGGYMHLSCYPCCFEPCSHFIFFTFSSLSTSIHTGYCMCFCVHSHSYSHFFQFCLPTLNLTITPLHFHFWMCQNHNGCPLSSCKL